MPEPQYTPPEVPADITERDRPAYLDGHKTGWGDAQANNLGHGTEPPEKINGEYYSERMWLYAWQDGVDAYHAAAGQL